MREGGDAAVFAQASSGIASELVVDVRWQNGHKMAVLRSGVVVVNDTTAPVEVAFTWDGGASKSQSRILPQGEAVVPLRALHDAHVAVRHHGKNFIPATVARLR